MIAALAGALDTTLIDLTTAVSEDLRQDLAAPAARPALAAQPVPAAQPAPAAQPVPAAQPLPAAQPASAPVALALAA
jgi:hypothetical protein